MDFYEISSLINLLTSIVIGCLIFLAEPRNWVNRLFFLFAAALSLWSFGFFMWQISSDADSALFWTRVLMAGSIWITPFYLHFISYLLKYKNGVTVLIKTGYLFALIFSIANWTPFFISGVVPKGGFEFWPEPGLLYHLFLFAWVIYVLAPIVLLAKRYWHADTDQLKQLRPLLIGTIIGYSGGVTAYFLWYDIPIPPFGVISASLYIAFVGYAIAKFQLFNVKAVTAQLLTLVLWLVLLVQLFSDSTTREQITTGVVLAFTLLVGGFLIRSVDEEVKQRKRAEKLSKDLAKANARLKELDKMKSEFVSIASHQLRSPLTAIRGYTSMLLEGSFGKLPAKATDAVNRIAESSRYMATSVEDYLNVSRIQSGNMKYDMSEFDIKEIAKKIVEDMRQEATKKGILLSFRSQADCDCLVQADVGKTRQIIQNLVDNAMKYTKKGSITVEVQSTAKPKRVRINVVDTGIGMSAQTLDRIFGKFERARNANEVNVTGTGLGLFVAKKMTEDMGGTVTAASDGEGEGSTFTIEFPYIR